MNEHVAIVIVGYRCATEIRRCLEAIAASTHTHYEVHVCENGGSEAYQTLVDVLSRSPMLTTSLPEQPCGRAVETQVARFRRGGQRLFLHRANDNLGYGGGINLGLDCLAHSSGWSWVWVLNPDTEVDCGAMAALVSHGRQDRYGIIGSRLVLADTGRIQLYGGHWRPWMARGLNLGLGAPVDARPDIDAVERQLDYVSGASMFVRRRYIEAVGRLSERYFLYDEDVEWCLRRGGFRLGYAHDAIVRHRHGAAIGSSHNRALRSGLSVYLDERNKILLTRRFYPLRYPIVVVVALLLTGQYILAGAYRNFAYAVRGWAAGLLGRDGPPSWLDRNRMADTMPAEEDVRQEPVAMSK